jgi:heme-degrading monooxygenase HmoA
MRHFFLFVFVSFAGSTVAQTRDYSADVQSPDKIIAALYEVISGAGDQERDWNRFKNLFTEDARLIPTFTNKEGKTAYRNITPAEYAESFSKNIKTKPGFFETELFHKTEEFGNIVHVFSTYESREIKDGPVFMRGINSIQLLRKDNRYFVVTVFWSSETKEHPLPEKYLH